MSRTRPASIGMLNVVNEPALAAERWPVFCTGIGPRHPVTPRPGTFPRIAVMADGVAPGSRMTDSPGAVRTAAHRAADAPRCPAVDIDARPRWIRRAGGRHTAGVGVVSSEQIRVSYPSGTSDTRCETSRFVLPDTWPTRQRERRDDR